MTTIPAVVTIQDLPTGTTLTGAELLEAVQTSGGVAQSIQVPVSQIMTTTLGALPSGGGTGQILQSQGTGFLAQWANIGSLVTASTGLSASGSTTVALSVAAGGINTSQLSSSIWANPTGSTGVSAVNGVASTVMRSDSAPAINQAMAPTWTAVHNFNALATAVILNGGGLQINPSTGTTNGIVITQNASGPSPNPAVLNAINIISDSMDASGAGNAADGWAMFHAFGGSSMKGARNAAQIQAFLISSTSAGNTNPNYCGLTVSAVASSNDGGGSGTERGAMFGFNPIVQLGTAATHMSEGSGVEVNTLWNTGASGLLKYGIKVVQLAGDKVCGSTFDSALSFANQAGAVGWSTALIQVGDGLNAFPLKTTASLLTVSGSGTITNGIDVSNATITGATIKSPGFTLSGTGTFTATLSGVVNAFGAQPAVQFQRADGTSGGPSALQPGDGIGAIQWVGHTGAGYAGPQAQILVQASQTWNGTSQGTEIFFRNTPSNSTTLTNAAFIAPSGGFAVGTTGDPGTGSIMNTGFVQAGSGANFTSGGTTSFGFKMSSVSNFGIFCGTGVPTISAGTGSLYLRSDATNATTRLYINTNGGGTWTSFTTIL